MFAGDGNPGEGEGIVCSPMHPALYSFHEYTPSCIVCRRCRHLHFGGISKTKVSDVQVLYFSLPLSAESASWVQARVETTRAPRGSAPTASRNTNRQTNTSHPKTARQPTLPPLFRLIRVRVLDDCPKNNLACAGTPLTVSKNDEHNFPTLAKLRCTAVHVVPTTFVTLMVHSRTNVLRTPWAASKQSHFTGRREISPGCCCYVAGQGSCALAAAVANLCCPRLFWIPFGQVLDDESDWIVWFLDKQPLDDLNEQAATVANKRDAVSPRD